MRLFRSDFQARKQPGFCGAVIFIGAVLVHMLVGDICDNANVELTGIDAVLCPAMRGRFQNDMCQACLDHLGQIALHVVGVRRGHVKAGIQHLIPNYRVDCGDHPRFDRRGKQDPVDKVCRGGLAVGAGHADHRQLAAGPVVEGGGDPGEGAAGVF